MKIKEEDVAKKVLEHLEQKGWDCYPEAMVVGARGRADIAATKDGILRIVEVKNSLSLQLLNQANEWIRQRGADQVYIAVPTNRATPLVEEILRWKGIGLFHVDMRSKNERHHHVYERRVAQQQNVVETRKKKIINSLHPDMKNYQPGTSGSYSTPYNRTIKMIIDYLKQHKQATLDDLLKLEHHYASKSSAKRSLSTALQTFESDKFDCKTEGKKLVFSLRV